MMWKQLQMLYFNFCKKNHKGGGGWLAGEDFWDNPSWQNTALPRWYTDKKKIHNQQNQTVWLPVIMLKLQFSGVVFSYARSSTPNPCE